ncbi:protein PSP1 [Rhypophila decipiens]
MSSGPIKTNQPPKAGQGNFSSIAPSSQAILLDKLGRRSTPDSEALASSDDEGDPHRLDNIPPSVHPPKPVRRASWLNDMSQQPPPHPRKGSFASSSMSPTTSHPSTPSADAGVGAWGTHSGSSAVMGRGHGVPGSFTWGTGIWNSERKEPPSRLAEVLPSPTTVVPPGGSGSSFFGGDAGLTQTSPAPRDTQPNSQIPFAIPLHPTPKTYRSQSYSVGQLDPETTPTSMGPSTILGSRARVPHSGLQHRPSRPSMLSEMSNDGSMLGKVNEDEDDDSAGSLQGSLHQSTEAKTIEMLTRENAMLRQQQYLRPRGRASTSGTYGIGNGYDPVLEESDYAVDEQDDTNDASELAAKRILARRMSEYGAGASPYRTQLLVDRKLENVKKGFWQTQSPFGGLGDLPQSRRHSFADVPTRQASISSIGEAASQDLSAQDSPHVQDYSSPYSDMAGFPGNNQVSSYFTGTATAPQPGQHPSYGPQYPSPYSLHTPYSSNRPASPHRAMYGMGQPRHNQSLHIVLFKCARADVFYIQEGTGLTVKPGDLVIVEADRGTDLGTVAKDNVDWQTAKELKEHYAEEQYKWLMMYSQNAAAAQEGAGAGLMAAANGLQGSAVGGMGPPNQHHMQEPNSGELKPKLIKRLAQQHEIHALRDKEGNEAKAKRVCMQKVKEHGLNMEILDAEFQMDWKKLTFYYFADSYINFNSLVTDLFKIYKTRIWMSAINPASFASPTLGLQAPSGIGPGAVGVNRGSSAGERRNNAQQEQAATYPGAGQAARGNPQQPFAAPYSADRGAALPSAYPVPNYPYNPYGTAFGNAAARPNALPYAPGMMQSLDAYQNVFPQSGDYGRGRFPASQTPGSQQEQLNPALGSQTDWVGTFQGLSLNTR